MARIKGRTATLVAAAVTVCAVGVVGGLAAHTGAQTPPSPTLAPWNTTTSLPQARSRNGAVFTDGYLYLMGGVNTSGATVNTVYYAPVNANGNVGNWNTTTSLPGNRRTVRPVAYNDFVYFAGRQRRRGLPQRGLLRRGQRQRHDRGLEHHDAPARGPDLPLHRRLQRIPLHRRRQHRAVVHDHGPHGADQRQRHDRLVEHHQLAPGGPLRQRRGGHGGERLHVRGRRVRQRQRDLGRLLRARSTPTGRSAPGRPTPTA